MSPGLKNAHVLLDDIRGDGESLCMSEPYRLWGKRLVGELNAEGDGSSPALSSAVSENSLNSSLVSSDWMGWRGM